MYHINEVDGKFHIVEKSTGYTVATKVDRQEASKVRKSLSMGHGFAGFTPEFFTLEYSLSFSSS